MPRTAETQRAFAGPALWSRGFRPFFLAAGLWAGLAIAIWPAVFTGEVELPTALSVVDWHVHEMLFGYGAAVVAGFLLTAIPNWTGRLPVAGRGLMALAGLWLVGRAGMLLSGVIGWGAALLLDGAFLLVFAGVAAREVAAGRNWRNGKVVGVLTLFALTNIAFHLEAAWTGAAPVAARAGIGLLVFLILLVGGRVVPSFTHNWLAKQSIAERPAPFDRGDRAVMVLSAVALLAWIAWPDTEPAGGLLLAAGTVNIWRLARWQGWRTGRDPLVLVLHVGFGFAAAGFFATAAHALAPAQVPPAFGLHVWAIGAVGVMTLAIMTRATLGHTGRTLRASALTNVSYSLIVLALVLRSGMVFSSDGAMVLLYSSAACWVAAFLLFVAVYGRMMVQR